MSVSVNLQEVFSADSQSNLTQKINFNFNQLLTLGLGEAGPIGLTGGPGPIGPVGPIGLTGDRGTRVYSTLTINSPILDPALAPNSENGDLYINTRELFVKGNTTSGIWEGVVDFQALITSQSLQDVFKVFQLGVGGGDADSKHAKFLRTNGVDATNSGFSSSHPMYYTGSSTPNNTQLILSNFDELKTWKIQAGSLVENDNESDDIFEYSALAKIYAFLPSSVSGWRHQLEIGSVDDVSVTVGGVSQQYVLTPSEQNLKIRKYRVAAAALEGGLYNTAELDLSGLTASSNSLNSEIILAVNKKTPTVSQIIQMGLTTSPILADRLASANLGTDGLILSKANTQHIAFGFDNAIASRINLNTSSNISLLKVNHANLNLANGNLAITVDDLAKEISLGAAIKVKNDRLSKGLPFPATPVLSTDPNTLDDYEEGSWTPSMETVNPMPIPGSDNDGGNNYPNPTGVGRYVKIGKFVFITFQIDVRFILDNGVDIDQVSPLNLGFTSAGFTEYGNETYGMRLTGLPNIASDTSVIFDIELRAIVSTNQTLRTQTLTTLYSDGQSSTQIDLQPIVPGSIFGRYYCQGATNPTPRIELLGNRYATTGDRVSSIASRVQPYDFLKEYTTNAGEYTRIHGSGWIIDNGACASGENQSEQVTSTQASA